MDSDQHRQRKYYQGVEQNLEAMAVQYGQGWTMRLYHNLAASHPLHPDLSCLASSHSQLDLCYVPQLPQAVKPDATALDPMMWRFLPSLDPQVDVLLSRDLDSRLTSREAAAVQEWLESGRAVHSMRDHASHQMPMMGGMWGTRLTQPGVRQKWRSAWQRMRTDSVITVGRYSYDQSMLELYVWPWARDDSLEHDSYTCHIFPRSVGFPTERRDEPENFVGNAVSENSHLWRICPLQCRRKGQPDWQYC